MGLPRCCNSMLLSMLVPDLYTHGDVRRGARPRWWRSRAAGAANRGVVVRRRKANAEDCCPSLRDWGNLTLYVTKNFPLPPQGYNEKAKITLLTVLACLKAAGVADLAEVQEVLDCQRGQDSMAVTNLLLLYGCGNAHGIQSFLRASGLLWCPMSRWALDAEDAVLMRQTGWLDEDTYNAELAGQLRRLMSLTGRSTKEADWSNEGRMMNGIGPATTPKILLKGVEGGRIQWEDARPFMYRSARRLAKELVESVGNKGVKFSTWWAQRSIFTPSGSSSFPKAELSDRMGRNVTDLNKKTAVEAYTLANYVAWLEAPAHCDIRASTKHEPGHKNRPLYATDDHHSLISAFASLNMEKAFHKYGVCISQQPSDVLDWLELHLARPLNWAVSYDYSAYNQQHETRLLRVLDLAVAEAFYEAALSESRKGGERVAELGIRGLCSEWVAEAHLTRFVNYSGDPNNPKVRSLNGLFTGSRNTARDNTILHQVYNEHIAANFRELTGKAIDMNCTVKSGDDEVVCLRSQLDALMYVRAVEFSGYEGKRSKLMVCEGGGEFLQLFMNKESPYPRYPLPPVLATFSSGNWYKNPVRDTVGTVASLVSQVWNMVREGMEYRFGLALVTATADWFMRMPREVDPVDDSTEGKDKGPIKVLERIPWLHLAPEGNNPLELGLGRMGTVKLTEPVLQGLAFQQAEMSAWPQEAAKDLMELEDPYWAAFDRLGQAQTKRDRLLRAYGPVVRHELDKEYLQAVRDQLETKLGADWSTVSESRGLDELLEKVLGSAVAERTRNSLLHDHAHAVAFLRAHTRRSFTQERVTTFETTCLRHGAPPELVKRLYGTDEYHKLPLRLRSDLAACGDELRGFARRRSPQGATPRWAYQLPPAIMAAYEMVIG